MKTLPLAAVDRLLHRTQAVPHLARTLTHAALDNARRSLETVSRSVDERRLLQASLPAASVPGDLGAVDRDECLALLSTSSTGRLAYVARAGVPDIVPVNYSLSGDHVLIRTGSGPKLQAAQRRETVAFEVDQIDEADHSGWSVVVAGRLRVVEPNEPLEGPVPWATGPRRHLLLLETTRITGRRLVGDALPR